MSASSWVLLNQPNLSGNISGGNMSRWAALTWGWVYSDLSWIVWWPQETFCRYIYTYDGLTDKVKTDYDSLLFLQQSGSDPNNISDGFMNSVIAVFHCGIWQTSEKLLIDSLYTRQRQHSVVRRINSIQTEQTSWVKELSKYGWNLSCPTNQAPQLPQNCNTGLLYNYYSFKMWAGARG